MKKALIFVVLSAVILSFSLTKTPKSAEAPAENTGTKNAANFVGTKDANPFSISTNDQSRIYIDPAGNVAINGVPGQMSNTFGVFQPQKFTVFGTFGQLAPDSSGNIMSISSTKEKGVGINYFDTSSHISPYPMLYGFRLQHIKGYSEGIYGTDLWGGGLESHLCANNDNSMDYHYRDGKTGIDSICFLWYHTGFKMMQNIRGTSPPDASIYPSPGILFEVDGKVRISDNTQAAGYVLTSDANGTASWQPGASGALPFYPNNKAAKAALGENKYYRTDGTDASLAGGAKGLVMQTY